jgi:hypothetical protein
MSRHLMKNKPSMKSKKIGDITEFQKIGDSRNCLLNVITYCVISLIILTQSLSFFYKNVTIISNGRLNIMTNNSNNYSECFKLSKISKLFLIMIIIN